MSRNQVPVGDWEMGEDGGELGCLRHSGDIQSATEDSLGSEQRLAMRLKRF